ncbi:hypothetical protein B0H16DRAFT_1562411 [Mycena metata]|uniref:Uncharacterized protein n=1 Tax=Mycena metata TaxID=1033252 RepID=A0AAD7IJ50_9AGAR|nr:hypothetical protein B0H16DRAFT_1562411 [Mycena metata]
MDSCTTTEVIRSLSFSFISSVRLSSLPPLYRTLKKDSGVFIYLTFGQPHFRRRFLTHPDTKLEIKELGEAFHYYIYVLRT